jgi:hypothetical protein
VHSTQDLVPRGSKLQVYGTATGLPYLLASLASEIKTMQANLIELRVDPGLGPGWPLVTFKGANIRLGAQAPLGLFRIAIEPITADIPELEQR